MCECVCILDVLANQSRRVGGHTPPPALPLLDALLLHGPATMLDALIDANSTRTDATSAISGGFQIVGLKLVGALPPAVSVLCVPALVW